MTPIRLTFWGAAGQVTGSMHLLEAAGGRWLLDGGLFQGHRAETHALNARLPFDARRVDGIVLSHAHIDHSGRLPLLVRHGFHGPIHSTPATRDLCAVMLPDAAHIQEKDHEFLVKRGKAGPESEPLYTLADAVAVQDLLVGVPYRRVTHLRKHLAMEFLDAGHILGSASVDLRITEGASHRLVFSGDIGRNDLPIIRDPEPPSGPIDTLIVESTYADRDHESVKDSEDRLGEAVRRTAARGGKVLIPAFALGRIQEVIYSLHQLFLGKRIPEIPIFVDSPLGVDATTVFRMHPEVFDQREQLVASGDAALRLPAGPLHPRRGRLEGDQRAERGPAVIVAASGMAESGRILHHLAHGIGDHRNLVLFVGFQARTRSAAGSRVARRWCGSSARNTSAARDRDHRRLLRPRRPRRAPRWVRRLGGPIRRAFVVHGEPPALEAMAGILKSEGVRDVTIPKHGESVEL